MSDICDPVAGYSYRIDRADKLVRRSKSACAKSEGLPASKVDAETIKLGVRSIGGFVAAGVKTTTVVAGSHKRGLVTTAETWFSLALQRIVYARFSDPKDGETTSNLINRSQAEHDPALFALPADYRIVDEKQ